MELYIFPNGDALRPDTITSVIFLERTDPDLHDNTYPDRVMIKDNADNYIFIYVESAEEGKQIRNKIIEDINEIISLL